MQVFDDPDAKEVMDYVGIDAMHMKKAIEVCDLDGDGKVDAQEFRTALESCKRYPMQSDLRALHQRVAHVEVQVELALKRQTELITARLDALENRLLATAPPPDAAVRPSLAPPSPLPATAQQQPQQRRPLPPIQAGSTGPP